MTIHLNKEVDLNLKISQKKDTNPAHELATDEIKNEIREFLNIEEETSCQDLAIAMLDIIILDICSDFLKLDNKFIDNIVINGKTFLLREFLNQYKKNEEKLSLTPLEYNIENFNDKTIKHSFFNHIKSLELKQSKKLIEQVSKYFVNKIIDKIERELDQGNKVVIILQGVYLWHLAIHNQDEVKCKKTIIENSKYELIYSILNCDEGLLEQLTLEPLKFFSPSGINILISESAEKIIQEIADEYENTFGKTLDNSELKNYLPDSIIQNFSSPDTIREMYERHWLSEVKSIAANMGFYYPPEIADKITDYTSMNLFKYLLKNNDTQQSPYFYIGDTIAKNFNIYYVFEVLMSGYDQAFFKNAYKVNDIITNNNIDDAALYAGYEIIHERFKSLGLYEAINIDVEKVSFYDNPFFKMHEENICKNEAEESVPCININTYNIYNALILSLTKEKYVSGDFNTFDISGTTYKLLKQSRGDNYILIFRYDESKEEYLPVTSYAEINVISKEVIIKNLKFSQIINHSYHPYTNNIPQLEHLSTTAEQEFCNESNLAFYKDKFFPEQLSLIILNTNLYKQNTTCEQIVNFINKYKHKYPVILYILAKSLQNISNHSIQHTGLLLNIFKKVKQFETENQIYIELYANLIQCSTYYLEIISQPIYNDNEFENIINLINHIKISRNKLPSTFQEPTAIETAINFETNIYKRAQLLLEHVNKNERFKSSSAIFANIKLTATKLLENNIVTSIQKTTKNDEKIKIILALIKNLDSIYNVAKSDNDKENFNFKSILGTIIFPFINQLSVSKILDTYINHVKYYEININDICNTYEELTHCICRIYKIPYKEIHTNSSAINGSSKIAKILKTHLFHISKIDVTSQENSFQYLQAYFLQTAKHIFHHRTDFSYSLNNIIEHTNELSPAQKIELINYIYSNIQNQTQFSLSFIFNYYALYVTSLNGIPKNYQTSIKEKYYKMVSHIKNMLIIDDYIKNKDILFYLNIFFDKKPKTSWDKGYFMRTTLYQDESLKQLLSTNPKAFLNAYNTFGIYKNTLLELLEKTLTIHLEEKDLIKLTNENSIMEIITDSLYDNIFITNTPVREYLLLKAINSNYNMLESIDADISQKFKQNTINILSSKYNDIHMFFVYFEHNIKILLPNISRKFNNKTKEFKVSSKLYKTVNCFYAKFFNISVKYLNYIQDNNNSNTSNHDEKDKIIENIKVVVNNLHDVMLNLNQSWMLFSGLKLTLDSPIAEYKKTYKIVAKFCLKSYTNTLNKNKSLISLPNFAIYPQIVVTNIFSNQSLEEIKEETNKIQERIPSFIQMKKTKIDKIFRYFNFECSYYLQRLQLDLQTTSFNEFIEIIRNLIEKVLYFVEYFKLTEIHNNLIIPEIDNFLTKLFNYYSNFVYIETKILLDILSLKNKLLKVTGLQTLYKEPDEGLSNYQKAMWNLSRLCGTLENQSQTTKDNTIKETFTEIKEIIEKRHEDNIHNTITNTNTDITLKIFNNNYAPILHELYSIKNSCESEKLITNSFILKFTKIHPIPDPDIKHLDLFKTKTLLLFDIYNNLQDKDIVSIKMCSLYSLKNKIRQHLEKYFKLISNNQIMNDTYEPNQIKELNTSIFEVIKEITLLDNKIKLEIYFLNQVIDSINNANPFREHTKLMNCQEIFALAKDNQLIDTTYNIGQSIDKKYLSYIKEYTNTTLVNILSRNTNEEYNDNLNTMFTNLKILLNAKIYSKNGSSSIGTDDYMNTYQHIIFTFLKNIIDNINVNNNIKKIWRCILIHVSKCISIKKLIDTMEQFNEIKKNDLIQNSFILELFVIIRKNIIYKINDYIRSNSLNINNQYISTIYINTLFLPVDEYILEPFTRIENKEMKSHITKIIDLLPDEIKAVYPCYSKFEKDSLQPTLKKIRI